MITLFAIEWAILLQQQCGASSGGRLEGCGGQCQGCGPKCQHNGGVGVDPSLLEHTHIYLYTDSSTYMNQDLECQMLGPGGMPTSIVVYLKIEVRCYVVHFAYIIECQTTPCDLHSHIYCGWYS